MGMNIVKFEEHQAVYAKYLIRLREWSSLRLADAIHKFYELWIAAQSTMNDFFRCLVQISNYEFGPDSFCIGPDLLC